MSRKLLTKARVKLLCSQILKLKMPSPWKNSIDWQIAMVHITYVFNVTNAGYLSRKLLSKIDKK